MDSLLLIKNLVDWKKFKSELMLQYGIEEDLVNWGDSSYPSSFPCLASGVIVDTSIVCVFVYPEDAERLLSEVQMAAIEKEEEVIPGVPSESVWSRHMVAFFLAMLHELISVGITKEERFEPLVAKMLSLVDQKHATDLDRVKELIEQEFRKKGE